MFHIYCPQITNSLFNCISIFIVPNESYSYIFLSAIPTHICPSLDRLRFSPLCGCFRGEPCTIQCVLAMGTIPQLQCKKCLCLFHMECVRRPGGGGPSVANYVCEVGVQVLLERSEIKRLNWHLYREYRLSLKLYSILFLVIHYFYT